MDGRGERGEIAWIKEGGCACMPCVCRVSWLVVYHRDHTRPPAPFTSAYSRRLALFGLGLRIWSALVSASGDVVALASTMSSSDKAILTSLYGAKMHAYHNKTWVKKWCVKGYVGRIGGDTVRCKHHILRPFWQAGEYIRSLIYRIRKEERWELPQEQCGSLGAALGLRFLVLILVLPIVFVAFAELETRCMIKEV